MTDVFKKVILPIISLIIIMMGNAFFLSYTSLKLQIDGYSIELIGFITSSYFLGYLIGSIRSHRIIQKLGHTKAYCCFAAFFGIFSTIQSIFPWPIFWIFIRFFSGFLIAGIFVCIESLVLGKTTIKTKGKIFSLYMILYLTSRALGQFFLNISHMTTISTLAIATILPALSILPICISKQQDPIIEQSSYLNLKNLLKISRLGVLGCLFSGFFAGPIYGMISVYVKNLGFSTRSISFAVALTIIGGLFLQWPLGKLSDNIDRRKVLLLSSIGVIALSSFLWINTIYSFMSALFLLPIFGGFAFTIYPLSVSYTSDFVQIEDFTKTSASLTLVYSIGAMIGPTFASYFMNYFASQGLFIYFLVISSLLFFYCIGSLMYKKSPEKEAAPVKIDIEKEK